MTREANLKFLNMSLVHSDPPKIVILKRDSQYHTVVAEAYRLKNVLTMERPMPTVTAALEYLLDMIAEHLANVHDKCFTHCPTPEGQFGETVENDLWLNRGSYYEPALTPSATSEAAASDSETESESTERESSEPTSVGETPPPAYSSVQIPDRLPTPFASPTGRNSRAQARRRPASAMDSADEDDTPRGNPLRRSTRIRRNNE
jgi:hypothetical protein